MKKIFAVLMLFVSASPAHAETKEEWIALGARVHGAFGAFIPVGIRIGEDAKKRLHAQMRELTVDYIWGEAAPCPCIADGIALAVGASAGQNTLGIMPQKEKGVVMRAIIKHRKTGEALEYTITEEWLPKILDWNRQFDAAGRYDAAMKAENLFHVKPLR
jgi:formylmethanofuran dehydrogenase subunit E